ncbi:MAG: DUF3387 domain-containing protein [Betaproteobacteria bacterium]|nr:DUF3387 domain-containing protein [Betaproteobacteria bacterium]
MRSRVSDEPTVKSIARGLVIVVENSATIDWTVCDSVRTNLRVISERVLWKYSYLPDQQVRATRTVLEQAEVLPGGATT